MRAKKVSKTFSVFVFLIIIIKNSAHIDANPMLMLTLADFFSFLKVYVKLSFKGVCIVTLQHSPLQSVNYGDLSSFFNVCLFILLR